MSLPFFWVEDASSPISAERNSATIWDETAQFLPSKADDLRRQGGSVYLAKWVVEEGVLRDATTTVSRLTHSVGSRLVCLWLLAVLGIYVAGAPRNAGQIDQPYGDLAPG